MIIVVLRSECKFKIFLLKKVKKGVFFIRQSSALFWILIRERMFQNSHQKIFYSSVPVETNGLLPPAVALYHAKL